MAVWSAVRLSSLTPDLRLDAEYYRPDLLKLDRELEHLQARRFGDIGGQFVVGPFGSDFNVENYIDDSPYRYVRGKDVKPFFLQDDDNAYMPRAEFDRLSKYALKPFDILISVVGTLGNCAIVPEAIGKAVFSCKSTVWRPPELRDDFAFYLAAYLNCRIGQALFQRMPRGHVQTGLNLDDLRSMPIVEPDSQNLKRIAAMVRRSQLEVSNARAAVTAAEMLLMEALGLDRLNLTPQKCYFRRFGDLQAETRFDAEYFNPKYQRIIRRLREGGQTLANVAALSERVFNPAGWTTSSTFRYIEIGSLSGDGEAESEIVEIVDAPSRATWIVRPGDIITSTVRPIRRLSALIRDNQDGCVCSSGFAVLTPKSGADGVEPEVLLTYLRLPVICEILDLHTTASMYPAIPVHRLMNMPIIVPDRRARKQIVAKVQEGMAFRGESARLLREATKKVEELIASEFGRGK